MSAPLRGVLIGAGYFAQFHAEAWRRVAGAEVVAVADMDAGRAVEFAGRWGLPRWYADPAVMLARETPDFVDVVTRPETHLELARLAADRGVHVLCQKPLSPTWAESVALVEECAGRGVRLFVHENWRWQPWYRAAKVLLDAGAVGQVFRLSFHMRTGDGRGPEPYPQQPYFRTMPRLLLHETGVHFLDTLRFLGGEVSGVFCRTARLNPHVRGEDAACVLLEFASGASGLFDANRHSGPHPPEVAFAALCVEGAAGVLRVSPGGAVSVAPLGAAEVRQEVAVPAGGYRGDSVRAALQHYVNCLRDGTPCETEGREYLRTVALVEACYQSAASGRWESVG